MKNIYIEIKKRFKYMILTSIFIVTLVANISNKILILMLKPLLTVNIELYNKIIYSIINKSYNIYDIQQCNLEKKTYLYEMDYFPTFELNLPLIGTQSIYTWIIVWLILYMLYPMVIYQIYTTIIPSLYIHEKKKFNDLIIISFVCYLLPIFETHYISMPIEFNYTFHNYQEYSFYEIDVEFDLLTYVKKYIKHIYINSITTTIILYKIKKKEVEHIYIFNIIIWILNVSSIINVPIITVIIKNIIAVELIKLSVIYQKYLTLYYKQEK